MKKNNKIVGLFLTLAVYGCTNVPSNMTPTNNQNASVNNNNSSTPSSVATTSSPIISTTANSSLQNTFNPEYSEFKVGKDRTTFQGEVSSILMDDGTSVITWVAVEGTSLNIYAQRFNKEFKLEGDEFKVNTINIERNQDSFNEIIKASSIKPQVVADNTNGFVIVWLNNNKLFLRKYDKTGNATVPEFNPKFNLNGQESNITIGSSVLATGNGNFLITGSAQYYGEDGALSHGQIFDSNFKPISKLIKIPTTPSRIYPVKDVNGNILLVCLKYNESTGRFEFYGQRYDSSLNPIKTEFKINEISNDLSHYASFSTDKDGNISFVGEHRGESFDIWNLFLYRYDSNNNPISSSMVNTEKINFSQLPIPKISVNDNGDFVVAWGEEDTNHRIGDIYARRYNKNGEPKEKEFKVNYLSRGFKAKPDVVLNNNGDFLITWCNLNDNQNAYQIYARKYNINQQLPFDDLAKIVNEITDCKPNSSQLNEINNQQSYKGDLKIKVNSNGKVIELKSSQDYLNLQQSTYPPTESLTFKIFKSDCLNDIVNKYGIKISNGLFGFNYMYGYDSNKISLDRFEELLRKYIVKNDIKLTEFSYVSADALRNFALYLELELNYKYLFEELYVTPKVVAN